MNSELRFATLPLNTASQGRDHVAVTGRPGRQPGGWYGNICNPLMTPYRDGTTHVIFEPLDFIARLAALVLKPRINLTRLDEKHLCSSPFR